MAHNLFGERFIAARIPAWHNLGIVIPADEQLTASEAFKRVGLDYRYHILPIGVHLPDGTFTPTTRQMSVYREPTHDDPAWKQLGIVSAGYSFLQNDELAAGIDAISRKTGWTFETAGALGNGGTVFVSLRAGTHSIFGDEVQSYFLVSDGKAANRALRIAVTPVRVVCQNTLLASDSSSTLSVTIPHASGVNNEYAFWLNMISTLERSQESAFAELRQMASVKIEEPDALKIFKDAFREPSKNRRVRMSEALPGMTGIDAEVIEEANLALGRSVAAYEYNVEQTRRWTEGAMDLYRRFNAGAEQGGSMAPAALEAVSRTPYAALQAVTEICDFGGTNRASVASATLFGTRAAQKSRAWASALRMANASLN